MATSKLYDVLSNIIDINEKILKKANGNLNILLNGDKNISGGVDEWDENSSTQGSLASIKTSINDLTALIGAGIPFGSLEEALEAFRIITEGTDEEVQAYGIEHSIKTYSEMTLANAPAINLGPCTEIGIISDETAARITWKDPENVVMENAVIAEWDKTELWRCEGSNPPEYPGAPSSVLIAKTSRNGDGNTKNSYYYDAFLDETISPNTDYSYKLFSYNTVGTCNNLIENIIPKTRTWSWGMLHSLSQAGTLLNYVDIGDLFIFSHAVYGEVVCRLMDYDAITATNPSQNPHTAVFQTVDCLLQSIWDKDELPYALTEDSTVNGSKTYYTKSGNTYTAATLTAGDPIPSNTYYEKNVNDYPQYGTNKWDESNIVQWLNAETEYNWYVKKNLWDRCDFTDRKGFFKGLEQSLKDVIVPVNRTEKYSDHYGGLNITGSYKIFLPFIREITGTNKTTEGLRQWAWYADTSNSKIKTLDGNPYRWCTMSSVAAGWANIWVMDTSGGSGSSGQWVKNSNGISPCFCI